MRWRVGSSASIIDIGVKGLEKSCDAGKEDGRDDGENQDAKRWNKRAVRVTQMTEGENGMPTAMCGSSLCWI